MKNTGDLDAALGETVEQDEGPDGEGAEIGAELRSFTSHRRLRRKQFSFCVDGVDEPVGGFEIPRVLGGSGISILSTPKGIMTGNQARKQNVGGELLALIW